MYGVWLVMKFHKEYRHQQKNISLGGGSLSGSQQLSEMKLNFKIQELQCYSRVWTVPSLFLSTYVFHNHCISPLESN